MKVLFFLRRIGPYHHARFQAVAQQMVLTTIETRPLSTEYPWQFHAEANYEREKITAQGNSEKGLRGKELHAEIYRIIDKWKPDVIVTTGWADPEYHACILQAQNAHIPMVVISDSRYEDEPRVAWKEWIKKIILKSYSAAITAGTESKSYLLRLGMKSDCLFLPWDVVDNDYFAMSSTGSKFTERNFLCISRFIQKKNLMTLLNAFLMYKKKGGLRKLTLAGSGEQQDEIVSFIRENQLIEEIELPGFVQYEELPALYQSGYCLILPSTSDQWGLVVNEAMASGVPVIVSINCGCCVDLVKNGYNGYAFNPKDTLELSDLLLVMDTKPELEWNEMSRYAKSTIAEWNIEHFGVTTLAACHKAISKPMRGRSGIIHQILSR